MSKLLYAKGFATLSEERSIGDLEINGTVPEWLNGSLFRNGPAGFEVGKQSYRHWFDGLGMLHRFTIKNGRVSYTNRYVRSPAYLAAREKGRISYSEFATDPCRSMFKRLASTFVPSSPGHNANVNVVKLGERFLALTETPMPVEFDSHTLDTLGVIEYDDSVAGQHTTPHPHYDATTDSAVNSITHFGPRSSYVFYSIAGNLSGRSAIGSIPVKEPSCIHSFGISENYYILVEYPLVANPLGMLLSGRPFIENFRWKPERGTVFHLVRKSDGKVAGTYRGNAFFAFHHINAFERDNEVVVDISCYDDASVVNDFYLKRLTTGIQKFPRPHYMRFHLDIVSGAIRSEEIGKTGIELPRINYMSYNGKDYRYAYGVSTDRSSGEGIFNLLVKTDNRERSERIWKIHGHYPGEPVFVPAPDTRDEDDGVLLSVVLDGSSGSSYLLILDAGDLSELGRAELPHSIPFGFHGMYVG